MKSWAPFLLPLAVLGCAASLSEGASFQPAYYPSGGAVPPAVPPCTGPITVTVADVRDNPSEVGRRFEEKRPGVDYPIKMTGDVTAYVRSALEALLKRAGNPGPDRRRSPSPSRWTSCTSRRRPIPMPSSRAGWGSRFSSTWRTRQLLAGRARLRAGGRTTARLRTRRTIRRL